MKIRELTTRQREIHEQAIERRRLKRNEKHEEAARKAIAAARIAEAIAQQSSVTNTMLAEASGLSIDMAGKIFGLSRIAVKLSDTQKGLNKVQKVLRVLKILSMSIKDAEIALKQMEICEMKAGRDEQ